MALCCASEKFSLLTNFGLARLRHGSRRSVSLIHTRLRCHSALSPAVAQAAIEKAEEEVRAIERMEPEKEEKQTVRIIRMLPHAAKLLRDRIGRGNLGLHDPRSIVQGRNTLFAMFGGKVPVRSAVVKAGEKPLPDCASRHQQRGAFGSCLGRQLCQIW